MTAHTDLIEHEFPCGSGCIDYWHTSWCREDRAKAARLAAAVEARVRASAKLCECLACVNDDVDAYDRCPRCAGRGVIFDGGG